jgi:hypothetical protein
VWYGLIAAALDPFPFREKDLDPSAEKYIVDWARELGPDRPLRIVVHLPAKESGDGRRSEIAGAFENFFNYRAAVVAGDGYASASRTHTERRLRNQ